MKRIIYLHVLWLCSLWGNAQTATTIAYKVTTISSPLCCATNTWCASDIDCNAGPFACPFNPASLDFRFVFTTPNPGGTLGANPFRYKVDLLHNGITIDFQQSQASAPPNPGNLLHGHTFNVTPLQLGQYQAKVLFQKFNILGWVNVGTYYSNVINVVSFCPPIIITPPPACNSNVSISGASFTTPLTESQTWIASTGSTVVPSGASVKLDADPANGFVLLNPGFETQPNANLVAQALDGCGAASPMRAPQSDGVLNEKDTAPKQGIAKRADNLVQGVYPNPTTGHIVVRHSQHIKVLQVYNTLGKLIKTINTNKSAITHIDLSALPSGIYLLRADGQVLDRIVKQ
jgi:hypothetical protein